ncbi:hypothetical protein KSS87_016881, partial [Heliosperma pusillum]
MRKETHLFNNAVYNANMVNEGILTKDLQCNIGNKSRKPFFTQGLTMYIMAMKTHCSHKE